MKIIKNISKNKICISKENYEFDVHFKVRGDDFGAKAFLLERKKWRI